MPLLFSLVLVGAFAGLLICLSEELQERTIRRHDLIRYEEVE